MQDEERRQRKEVSTEMKKEKLKIKARMKQVTKYTPEEKYALFTEGKIKVPTVTKTKKRYTRKEKHRKIYA